MIGDRKPQVTHMAARLEMAVAVGHPRGLHARVAATVVKIASEAVDRLGIRIQVSYGARKVPAENLLAMLSLTVRPGDWLTLHCECGDEGPMDGALAVLDQLRRFLAEGQIPTHDSQAGEVVDEIIHQATVTLDRVVDNLSHGMVVVNAQGEIILLNKAAEGYLNLKASDVLGQRAEDVIPNSELRRVLQTRRPEVARRQTAGGVTLVTNRTPIVVDNKVIGASALFQDISELERLASELQEYKALREKFTLLLDAVTECICVTNADGSVAFANTAFRQLFGDPPSWKRGGPMARALEAGQSVLGAVELAPSGGPIIQDVHVVRIGEKVHGAVAIGRTPEVVRELACKLEAEEARVEYLEHELVRARPLPPTFSRLIGTSGTLRDALSMAAKAAASTSTMLIRGESGTGKELVAEAIHLASARASRPFVRLNCAAIPPTLAESELFGHEKGAFTGAIKRRLGKFELAQGGTIFLDEIGTLDLNLQAKLLRVLQNRQLERVGGETSVPIDVRVIAATNADLEQLVRGGQFRGDLYYRLNVIGIFLPPLRDRRSDIPTLVEHFVDKLGARMNSPVIGFSADALRLMMAHDWPGNVRQLENVVERALTLCDGPYVTPTDLPGYLYREPINPYISLVSLLPTGDVAPLEDYERAIIRLALERHGSFNAAAKALGLTHRTVALKARQFGLTTNR